MAKLLPLLILFLSAATADVAGGGRSSPRRRVLSEERVTPAQVRNIIEALIGAGDFSSWANVLFGLDPATLPISSTLFIPADDVLARFDPRADFDPAVVQYHVVPRRLTFAQLRRLRPGDRLLTLLRNRTILVTGVHPSNFTLDDTHVTHPDVFNNDAVSIHGIGGVLDYKRYGSGSAPSLEGLEQGNASFSSPPPAATAGDRAPSTTSGASCGHCFAFLIIPISLASFYFVLILLCGTST